MSDNMTSRAISAAVDVMKNCGVDMLGGMLHRVQENAGQSDIIDGRLAKSLG